MENSRPFSKQFCQPICNKTQQRATDNTCTPCISCETKVLYVTPSISNLTHDNTSVCIVSYQLPAAYIIAKLSADSILDNNQKTPIVCGKCHVVHDVTILLS